MNKTKSLPSFAMLLSGYGYDVALWGAYPEYVELLWGQTPRKHWKLALPRKDSGKIREIFGKYSGNVWRWIICYHILGQRGQSPRKSKEAESWQGRQG